MSQLRKPKRSSFSVLNVVLIIIFANTSSFGTVKSAQSAPDLITRLYRNIDGPPITLCIDSIGISTIGSALYLLSRLKSIYLGSDFTHLSYLPDNTDISKVYLKGRRIDLCRIIVSGRSGGQRSTGLYKNKSCTVTERQGRLDVVEYDQARNDFDIDVYFCVYATVLYAITNDKSYFALNEQDLLVTQANSSPFYSLVNLYKWNKYNVDDKFSPRIAVSRCISNFSQTEELSIARAALSKCIARFGLILPPD